MLRLRLAVALLGGMLVAGCTTSGSDRTNPASTRTTSPPIVYAAIGASDGVGVGSTNPLRDAWPQVFFRTALPESTVMYNFSLPGATVARAISNEEPEALSVQPTLVTVWLNVNDLIALVSVSDYATELDQLLHDLRRGGQARVLIANTPYLDRVPLYLGCRAGAPPSGATCPPGLAEIPPAEINSEVDSYNAVIARLAQKDGAVVVDLHAQGEIPDLHPDWVGSDGFHPSTAGYAAIAAAFAAAWKQAGSPAA